MNKYLYWLLVVLFSCGAGYFFSLFSYQAIISVFYDSTGTNGKIWDYAGMTVLLLCTFYLILPIRLIKT